MSRLSKIPAVWLVVIAVFMWSTGGMFIKLAANLDAYQVTFYRSLLAAITVLVIVGRESLRINLFGLMVSVIYATLLFLFVWATKHTTAANAIFLQYTAPVYILVLAPFVIGEKFHLRDLGTVILCLAGMSLFFVGDLTLGEMRGNIAALGSGIFLGLYIMLLKHPSLRSEGVEEEERSDGDSKPANPRSAIRDPRSRPVSPIATVVIGNFILAAVTLPSGIDSFSVVTPTDLGAVAFLGIFQIGIAYILFIRGVAGGTRPLDASIIGFIEPLLNPVWVFLAVGERPTNWAILGGIIIITTVATHTFVQYRVQPQTTDPL